MPTLLPHFPPQDPSRHHFFPSQRPSQLHGQFLQRQFTMTAIKPEASLLIINPNSTVAMTDGLRPIVGSLLPPRVRASVQSIVAPLTSSPRYRSRQPISQALPTRRRQSTTKRRLAPPPKPASRTSSRSSIPTTAFSSRATRRTLSSPCSARAPTNP